MKKTGYTQMMHGHTMLATLVLLAAPALVQGETIGEASRRALETYRIDVTGPPIMAQTEAPLPMHGEDNVQGFAKKSTVRAFASSFIIPGLGQLYTGSKVKAAVFFGVEILGWVGYIHFRNEGDDRTSAYQTFADAHWDPEAYWLGMENYGSTRISSIPRWEDHNWFPHHLPWKDDGAGGKVEDRNGEYYENIGKYDQFVYGWDDKVDTLPGGTVDPAHPEIDYKSDHREIYLDMRADANSSYDKSRTAAIVLIANHLISAVDAGLSAGRYNRKAEQGRKLSFRVKVLNIEDTPTPWVSLAYRF